MPNEYPVPNADYIIAGRKMIGGTAAGGWADHFDDIYIPDDMEIAFKGAPANAGVIYIARTGPEAQRLDTSWSLLANEAIHYRIKRASEIWFSGTVAGDYVHFTVEQRRS